MKRASVLKRFFLFSLVFCSLFPSMGEAAGKLASRIHEVAASGAKNLTSYKDGGGRKIYKLYGQDIGDSTNEYGRLACARVVSIILREAGAGIGGHDVVGSMERSFKRKGWKEVSYAELDHGDIIVWSSRFSRGKECTGNGSCHIGV